MTTQHFGRNSEDSVVGDGEQAPLTPAPRRVVSSIAFPYGDLDDAVEIARAIHNRFGLSSEPDQLAALLGTTPANGTFRTKVATARIFGAVDVSRGSIALTDLGGRLADEHQEVSARAEAFLNVELYQRLFDNFRGRRLPGDRGLENEIKNLGVSPKQLNKARIAFQRSADQAGFFAHGDDRLVRPSGIARAPANVPAEAHSAGPERHERRDDSMLDDLHPLLAGLIKTIPREGEAFSPKRQRQWLEAAKVNFALIFGGDDDEEEPHGAKQHGAGVNG